MPPPAPTPSAPKCSRQILSEGRKFGVSDRLDHAAPRQARQRCAQPVYDAVHHAHHQPDRPGQDRFVGRKCGPRSAQGAVQPEQRAR